MLTRQLLRTATRLSTSLVLRRPSAKLRSLSSTPALPMTPSLRWMSTPPPQLATSDLSVERYHELSDTTMDTLLNSLEIFVDDNPSFEVEYHSGVLTLIIGDKGTYVINKQPPNMQIWLSSPFSGPKRYDYSAEQDDWLYARDGVSLGSLLEEELQNVTGMTVNLGLEGVSTQVQ